MADQTTNNVTQTKSLAPMERPDALAQLTPNQLDPSQSKVSYWSSLNPQTARERALLFNAMTGQVKPISKVIDEEIEVANVLLQVVQLANPVTGEIRPCVRTVLITPEMKMFGCVSDGVHESVKKLIGLNGLPPWPEGIKVVPRSGKAKVGNFYTLELVIPEDDKPAAPTPVKAATTPTAKSKAS